MSKKLLLLLHFTFCVFYFAVGQTAPGIEWQKSFGGTSTEEAHSIYQANDGGYIAAGYTVSNDGDVSGNHGSGDFWVIKIDTNGNLQWQKCLGGTNGETAYAILATQDGSYLIAGRTSSNDGNVSGNHDSIPPHTEDYWVVKLDSVGTLLWQKCFGGTGLENATSIEQTSDGGFVIFGRAGSNNGNVSGHHGGYDYWIVKIDSSGNLQWQKCLGGNSPDSGYAIRQTADGGFIVTGDAISNNGNVTGNHGGNDCWVVKLDSAANIQWQKCFGGTSAEISYDIRQTSDGGYINAGCTYSNNGDVTGNHDTTGNFFDIWIVKMDSAGTMQWQKCYGGTDNDESRSIEQTQDGGYIVTGVVASADGDVTGHHGDYDYWVFKIDSSGNIQWQKCFGGTGNDHPRSGHQTSNGGYVIAGLSGSTNGDVTGNHGMYDYWIVKLYPDTITSTTNIQSSINNFQLYPNPVTTELTISLNYPNYLNTPITISVFDVFGKQIFTTTTTLNYKLQTSNFPKGMYFINVIGEKINATKKFVKE